MNSRDGKTQPIAGLANISPAERPFHERHAPIAAWLALGLALLATIYAWQGMQLAARAMDQATTVHNRLNGSHY